jgi:acyl carrier protein
MNKQEIFDSVQDICRDIFDIDDLIISDNTTADDIEEWDSLNHINLLSVIEKEFKIKFPLGASEELKNIGDMINMIEDRINQ